MLDTLVPLAVSALLAALLPAAAQGAIGASVMRSPVQQRASVDDRELLLADGGTLSYAVAVPDDLGDDESLPLVLALHFGWQG